MCTLYAPFITNPGESSGLDLRLASNSLHNSFLSFSPFYPHHDQLPHLGRSYQVRLPTHLFYLSCYLFHIPLINYLGRSTLYIPNIILPVVMVSTLHTHMVLLLADLLLVLTFYPPPLLSKDTNAAVFRRDGTKIRTS